MTAYTFEDANRASHPSEHIPTALARKEAQSRYQGDWDPYHGEPVDDAGFSEAERRAFVAGAEWAADRRWRD